MNGIGRKPTPGTSNGIDNYGNKTSKDMTMQADKEMEHDNRIIRLYNPMKHPYGRLSQSLEDRYEEVWHSRP